MMPSKRKSKLKFDSKVITLYFKHIVVGISFGSGCIGSFYLMESGLHYSVSLVFAIGVVGTHFDYLKRFINNGKR